MRRKTRQESLAILKVWLLDCHALHGLLPPNKMVASHYGVSLRTGGNWLFALMDEGFLTQPYGPRGGYKLSPDWRQTCLGVD